VQLTWRGSPPAGLRVEVGDVVAHPVPSPQATIVLSVYRWKGAPAFTSAEPYDDAGEKPPSKSGGKSGRVAQTRAAVVRAGLSRVSGSRVLDPAWPAGPGSVLVEGLSPGTSYDVIAGAQGVPAFLVGRVTTLHPPEGRLLCRLAAVTDLHIGEKHFGVWGRIWDRSGYQPGAASYPVRALKAALAEADAWGAQLALAKGDLTRLATSAELMTAARLLAESPVPVEAVLGNHDNALDVDMRSVLQAGGVRVGWGPRAIDVPGLRLVLVNTVHADGRYHRGYLPASAGRQVAELAGEAPTPAMIVLHHPPELHRYPTVYPPGLPLDHSRALLDALAQSKPQALLTCGHRHRNRRYGYGPLVIAETGSTKDYPGVWTGYKVYEGGLLQVVRRTARPDVIGWTEATRRAINGQWGRWSPGDLGDRCFSVTWE
jgi:predicted phosphodiesterase